MTFQANHKIIKDGGIMKKERIIKKLDELDGCMYNLNANLSALIHIQKLKSKKEAEGFLRKINQEIGKWIREVREIKGQMETMGK